MIYKSEFSGRNASFGKMLRSWVLFVICSCASASYYDTWPFTLADKYIEEFKTNVEEFKKLAHSYQHHQEVIKHVEEEEDLLTDATKRKQIFLIKTTTKLSKNRWYKKLTLFLVLSHPKLLDKKQEEEDFFVKHHSPFTRVKYE